MTIAFLPSLALALAGVLALLCAWAIGRFGRRPGAGAEAGRRFQTTFEQAAVGIAHVDLEGILLRVNDRYCEIAGHHCPDLLRKPLQEITHPDDIPVDLALTDALLSGRKAHASVQKRYLRVDGSVAWVNETRSMVRDSGGQPDFFISVIEDIRTHKEAEAQLVTGEAQYRAIFDSAVEAMAVIDADGTVRSVNPSVERIFGYSPRELIGRNIKMLMPDAIKSNHDSYLRRYRETGVRAIIGIGREVIGRRKDGTEFPLDLSVAEWKHDDKTLFIGAMRDVTARKDGEAALRASEEELRLLHIEFAHLARVNDLGEMAAAIAHEINQPLTAIVNYLNTALLVALKHHGDDAFADAETMMKEASAQALRAGDIIRRLREFVAQGKGTRKVERLEQLVDSAMALALIDARSGGITVDRICGVGDARVEVDAVQVQQVLVNLLRNAIDALGSGPRKRARRLSVATAIGPEGFVEVAVADNGPGIAPGLKDHLFEPFVTSKADGMGMGLSVCRRLIEAHGGTIEASNTPGAGATFTFNLPRFGPGSDQTQTPHC